MSRKKIDLRPNLLDRAIGAVAPQAGLSRIKARYALALVSGFTGGSRKRRATSEWSTAVGSSADFDTLPDLDLLRARSRDLVRNDPLAHSAISTKVTSVVGPGHVVRPEVNAEALGISDDEAEAWEARALSIWTDWAGNADCDVTRTQTFPELEDLVFRSRLQSGDVFVVRRFRPRRHRLLATAVQVIEADRVSNPDWQGDSDRLAGGVELNADGAPVAYHFADRHVLDRGMPGTPSWTRVRAFGNDGNRIVLHVHGTRERPDMTRYAPMLAPVIESLKQRSRYSDAELMAAVVSACFAIGTKSPDGDLSGSLPEGVASADAAGGASDIALTDPGLIFDLLPNEEIQSFQPGRPNPQFISFIDAVAREIGAGTDLPTELLLKQFQASYSASRAALEMAWMFFRTERALHVTQFCQPIYRDVITEAVARGLLSAPGFFSDPLARSAYLGATWMGPARVSIDPVKDATADEKYLEMGATSLTRVTAERFGQDVRMVQKRRAQDGSAAAVRSQPAATAPTSGAAQIVEAPDEGFDHDLEKN